MKKTDATLRIFNLCWPKRIKEMMKKHMGTYLKEHNIQLSFGELNLFYLDIFLVGRISKVRRQRKSEISGVRVWSQKKLSFHNNIYIGLLTVLGEDASAAKNFLLIFANFVKYIFVSRTQVLLFPKVVSGISTF